MIRTRGRRRNVVVIDAHVLDGPTPGAWCDRCALPTALSWVVGTTVGGSPHRVEQFRRCTGCEAT